MRFRRSPVLASIFLLWATSACSAQQSATIQVATDKGFMSLPAHPHTLAWWTKNPLRLDLSGDLLIEPPGKGGLTAADYTVFIETTTVAKFASHRVLQLLFRVTPAAGVSAQSLAGRAQWKFLLVSSGSGRYLPVYGVEDDSGIAQPFQTAQVYGTGGKAMLVTNDPDSGNGGGCWDGYWSMDAKGVHAMDFSALEKAIRAAAPANSTYPLRCWAIHPKDRQISTWAQARDASCLSCGMLGSIEATYRIRHGRALPVQVHFTPGQP